jgi:AraC-like DNA-binding protein
MTGKGYPDQTGVEYRRIRYQQVPRLKFHLHDGFEIFFLISGDVKYLIEKRVYTARPGDIFITNHQELHRVFLQSDATYERITIIFKPAAIQAFNIYRFDLLHCFLQRPKGEYNRIALGDRQREEVRAYFDRIEQLDRRRSPESELLKTTCFIELLVWLNKIFQANQPVDEGPQIPEKLFAILSYIEAHLQQELSLASLANHFYFDKFYLNKLFKKHFGSSVYEYIVCKRVSKAKSLIREGFNFTETSHLCGFTDYSSFFRMFKKHMGVSPAQYKKMANAAINGAAEPGPRDRVAPKA